MTGTCLQRRIFLRIYLCWAGPGLILGVWPADVDQWEASILRPLWRCEEWATNSVRCVTYDWDSAVSYHRSISCDLTLEVFTSLTHTHRDREGAAFKQVHRLIIRSWVSSGNCFTWLEIFYNHDIRWAPVRVTTQTWSSTPLTAPPTTTIQQQQQQQQ